MPADAAPLRIAVSPGELLDKISILLIKSERIGEQHKLRNIRHELGLLQQVRSQLDFSPALGALEKELKQINEKLWDVEDAIRELELRQDFGARFIELARAVYINNDQRARIKKQINTMLGSKVVEEKSYSDYGNG